MSGVGELAHYPVDPPRPAALPGFVDLDRGPDLRGAHVGDYWPGRTEMRRVAHSFPKPHAPWVTAAESAAAALVPDPGATWVAVMDEHNRSLDLVDRRRDTHSPLNVLRPNG